MPKVTQLLGGRARFKPKQSGSSLCSFLLLPLNCRGRKNKRERRGEDRWGLFSSNVSQCLPGFKGSLRPTGHRVHGAGHSPPGALPACLLVQTAPVQRPGRDRRDPAPSSNKHVEMDGSHISQLQLAARFGEITFPGTNWEPVLEIKGTAH